jgi:hypothetical protein
MNETPAHDDPKSPETPSTKVETAGRVLFLLGGGVLLSVLVSCACGPVR